MVRGPHTCRVHTHTSNAQTADKISRQTFLFISHYQSVKTFFCARLTLRLSCLARDDDRHVGILIAPRDLSSDSSFLPNRDRERLLQIKNLDAIFICARPSNYFILSTFQVPIRTQLKTFRLFDLFSLIVIFKTS